MDNVQATNSPNDRDRSRRGERGTRFSDADNNPRDRSREKRESTRIYVSNVPYEYRWQDLKDLFRREVGDVEFVELFHDESNKPRGCGIVEFKNPECVKTAMEKMNKYDLNGRQLVVKEDYGNERDKYGRVIRNPGQGGGNRRNDRDDDRMPVRGNFGGPMGGGGMNDYDGGHFNTYGLSTSFLEGLGIMGPLHNKVFVANLDYKVDRKKLKQVFKLAGRIVNLDLSTDKEGNSRGFAVIEYEHPVEAVQAISMFDRQMLYERRMTVRLDRIPDKGEAMKLPEGLRAIGIGLGPNGEPLKNVAQNLPNIQQNSNQNNGPQSSVSNMMGGGGSGPSSILGPVPNSNLPGLGSNLSSNLAALSNVVGGLSNLSGGGMNNPLLSTAANLSNLGLGLGSNNDIAPTNAPGSFNQPSGNSYNSTGYGGSRSDFDMGGAQNSVRNYNTRPDDYNRGNNGGFGGMMNNGGGRKSDSIVIKNLPPSCTWQILRDKLRDIGEVTFAEIRAPDTGVVRFAKERDAELAIKLMDGTRFEGRTVDVQFF